MVERIQVGVFVDDTSHRFRPDGDGGFVMTGRGKSGSLYLCRKAAEFGDIRVDHWWMDWRSVYCDRDFRDSNHQTLIDLYWGMCKQAFTVTQEGVQETYLLAHLMPHVRSKGSRRVLLDSVLTSKSASSSDKAAVTTNLNQLLDQSREEETNLVGFRDSTADAIGPPIYGEEAEAAYDCFADELLGKGRNVLEQEGDRAIEFTVDLWKERMRTIGRRSGRDLEKQVLDILSYECRAAVHRCYSAVWDYLICFLDDKYELSDEEVVFHRFWHLERQMSSDQPDKARFHLFHGHIFGLHPAGAEFLQTTTGQSLMGEWLSAPESPASSGRLLHGLTVAVHDYASRNDVYAELRKRQPATRGGQDLVALEEHQAEKRSGRRRAHKRESDAR